MSRLKRLLHAPTPGTCNMQQNPVQPCTRVAQHAHTVQLATQKQEEDVARTEYLGVLHQEDELRRLVLLVSNHYGFAKEERAEALTVALGDQTNALTCFAALANKAGLI